MSDKSLTPQLARGMKALEEGNIEHAVVEFQSILSTDPFEFHALHFLGVAYCLDGRTDSGIELIQRSIRLDQSRFSPFLNLGRFCFLIGNYEQSRLALEQAIKKKPEDLTVLKMLAEVYLALEEYRLSTDVSCKLVTFSPSDPQAYFLHGVSLFRNGDFEGALSAYQHALRLNPSSLEVLVNLGDCLCNLSLLREAINKFEQAIAIDPSCYQAYVGAARAYSGINLWEDALSMSCRASELAPESCTDIFNIAYCYHKLGRISDAVDSYKKLISMDGGSCSQNYLCLGSALESLNDYASALIAYRKAILLDGTNAEACLFAGSILSDYYGDEPSAILLYETFLDGDPDNENILTALGHSYRDSGASDQALSCYQRILHINPASAQSMAGSGAIYRKKKIFDESISLLCRAIATDPCMSDAYYELFMAYRELEAQDSSADSLLDQLSGHILKELDVNKCIVFGDSHVSVFDGIPGFEKYWVGAATAYNLIKANSTSRGREKVLERLQSASQIDDAVILSFGEVDIRSNILKYCMSRDISIDQACDDVVARYMDFVSEIVALGFQVLVCGPYGSGDDKNSQGSISGRYYAAQVMDSSLRSKCQNLSVAYFSLNSLISDHCSQSSRLSFFEDGVHFPGYSFGNIESDIKCVLLSKLLESLNALRASSLELGPPALSQISLLTKDAVCLFYPLESLKPSFFRIGALSEEERTSLFKGSISSLVIDLGAVYSVDFLRLEFAGSSLMDVLASVSSFGLDGGSVIHHARIDSAKCVQDSSSCFCHFDFENCSFLRYLVVRASSPLGMALRDLELIGSRHVYG